MPHEYLVGQMVSCRVFVRNNTLVGCGPVENCPPDADTIWVQGKLTDVGPDGGEIHLGLDTFIRIPIPELNRPERTM